MEVKLLFLVTLLYPATTVKSKKDDFLFWCTSHFIVDHDFVSYLVKRNERFSYF